MTSTCLWELYPYLQCCETLNKLPDPGNSFTVGLYWHGVLFLKCWPPPFILCAEAGVPHGYRKSSLLYCSVNLRYSSGVNTPLSSCRMLFKVPITWYSDRKVLKDFVVSPNSRAKVIRNLTSVFCFGQGTVANNMQSLDSFRWVGNYIMK